MGGREVDDADNDEESGRGGIGRNDVVGGGEEDDNEVSGVDGGNDDNEEVVLVVEMQVKRFFLEALVA